MKRKELPTQAPLEQYGKQARELVKAHRRGGAETIWCIRNDHPRFRQMSDADVRSAAFTLADAQLIVAYWNYFGNWLHLWSRSPLPMRKYVPLPACWRRSVVSYPLGNTPRVLPSRQHKINRSADKPLFWRGLSSLPSATECMTPSRVP